MEEEVKSNVYPPTDQKLSSTPELKNQGAANVTAEPIDTAGELANVPESRPTTVFHPIASVAVLTLRVFSVTVPKKPMLPVMGIA